MDWTLTVTYADGTTEYFSCVTRQDARDARRRMLAWQEVVTAKITKYKGN